MSNPALRQSVILATTPSRLNRYFASPWAEVSYAFDVFAENLVVPLNRSAFDYAKHVPGGSRRIPLPEPAFSTNPYPIQRDCMATAKDL